MTETTGNWSMGSGPAFVALGVVFMASTNVALGAAFLALGAALTAKQRRETDVD